MSKTTKLQEILAKHGIQKTLILKPLDDLRWPSTVERTVEVEPLTEHTHDITTNHTGPIPLLDPQQIQQIQSTLEQQRVRALEEQQQIWEQHVHDIAMKESTLERKCVEAAEDAGWIALKLTRIGWPDRQFIGYGQTIWFVEFKTKTGVLMSSQARVHAKLKERGFKVHVVRRVDEFQDLLDHYQAVVNLLR